MCVKDVVTCEVFRIFSVWKSDMLVFYLINSYKGYYKVFCKEKWTKNNN